MPSGKRAKQQRQAAAAGGKTPPPVRSKGGGGDRGSRLSRRTLLIAGVVLLVLIGLAVGLPLAVSSSGGHGTSTQVEPIHAESLSKLGHLEPAPALGQPGPEGPPLETGPNLAPAGSPSPGQSVDGISCGTTEQLAFHIHTRLTAFVHGQSVKIPAGVGIADPQTEPTSSGPFVGQGACFSWLHTHAADGIVHIESPVHRTFTLGNFFDVWGQPLSASQVGPHTGRVTALYNGKVWLGNPRDIPLGSHTQIQLEVGKPLVAPEQITNWAGL
jgi:hypothetical protein